MARIKDKINRLSKGKEEYKMKYDLTKNQNEVAIEKLEISQETLKTSNLLLIRNLTRNLIKSKQEVNDLKFTHFQIHFPGGFPQFFTNFFSESCSVGLKVPENLVTRWV